MEWKWATAAATPLREPPVGTRVPGWSWSADLAGAKLRAFDLARLRLRERRNTLEQARQLVLRKNAAEAFHDVELAGVRIRDDEGFDDLSEHAARIGRADA